MKKCEICSAPATVFLTQIINGKSTKIALCNKCAKKKGVLDPSAFDLAEKLFQAIPDPDKTTPAPNKKQLSPIPKAQPITTRLPLTVCPNCGFTIEDYRKVGRLGCSRCYEVFAEEIMPVLADIQAGCSHKGKHPEHTARQVQMARDVSELEAQMKDAVKREDYEEAARLRDEIEKLQPVR